jgi:regulatory protein
VEREAAGEEITKVEQQKRNRRRFNIYLNGEYRFSVHEDLLVKYRLLKGDFVEPGQLEEILAEEEKHRAYLDALNFIAVRHRSVQEVNRKLKEKGYEPDLIRTTIGKLEEQGYLNDSQFAQQWAAERFDLQKKGRKWVEMELLQKGIDKREIASAISQLNEEAEWNNALEVGGKKWKQLTGEMQARKRKLYGFLARRGFPGPVVARVVKHFAGSAEDDAGYMEE